MAAIKKLLYRNLSLENYLRVLQRGYFAMYGSGLLKLSPKFDNHYYIRKLVRKGDTVIDIGANLGYYSIPLAKAVGRTGTVYSVEPIPLYNKIFTERARRYPAIQLLPYALGTEEKEVELVTATNSGYLNTGLPHIFDSSRDGQLESQEFRFPALMRRPSQLFRNLPRIDYIKCDVEGYELNVLTEMQELIATHKPIIQVEVWQQNEQLLTDLLVSLGYQPYRLHNKKLTPLRNCPATNKTDHIFLQTGNKIY